MKQKENERSEVPDATLVGLWKNLLSNLIQPKKLFEESDEIKFLTKVFCYTVLSTSKFLRSFRGCQILLM